MTHHTAGPWYARQDLDEAGIGIDAKNKAGLRYTIAMASYMGTADPQPAQANARLIAADPEMLQALKECVDFLQTQTSNRSCNLYNQVRDLIAKAEAQEVKA